jgi:hypothetical protein
MCELLDRVGQCRCVDLTECGRIARSMAAGERHGWRVQGGDASRPGGR